MVNFLRLSTLVAYIVRPVYKPESLLDALPVSSSKILNNPVVSLSAYTRRGASLSTYDVQPIGYKPTPGEKAASAVSNSGSSSGSSQQNFSVPSSSQGAGAAYIQQATKTKDAKTMKSSSDGDSASCTNVSPYDAPPVLDQEFPPYDQTTATVYRYRQQQSVNLGSWFVHEQWMTPSVFKCAADPQIAEIDIAKGWGSPDGAHAVLERHWDTFIQESDFQYLANIGINTVRLPIGYWNLGPNFTQGTAFEPVGQVYVNSWPRIVRAINQAGRAGVGVLIDLHGAVGSQNGQQHSGVSDGQTNLFSVPDNMDKTIAVLTYLAEKLGYVNNIVGIQILNEPQNSPGLPDFYSRAIDAMRAVSPNTKTMPLYVHDGFDLDQFSSYVAGRTDFVVQDHHSYFVFTPSDQSETGSQHTHDVEGPILKSLLNASNKQHRNLVVDEWSCALTPQGLEGDSDAEDVRKNFCRAQMDVYTNTTAGWGFWSYKKEDCDDDPGWCFTAAVGHSLPSNFFVHGNAVSMQEANALAQNVSDHLIIPTVTTEITNLIQSHMQSSVGGENSQGALVPRSRHRFDAISRKRSTQGESGQDADSGATKDSASKGYTDGFTTAKVFASYNMSRLGFRGQYLMDAIRNLGTLIKEGTEDGYRSGFMQGLQDGEKLATGSH